MAKTGLLILTSPLGHLKPLIPRVLEEASAAVSDTLYVCLQPSVYGQHSNLVQPISSTQEVKDFISGVYLYGSSACSSLDIRVLLSHILRDPVSSVFKNYTLRKEISICLTDSVSFNENWHADRLSSIRSLQNNFTAVSSDCMMHFVNAGPEMQGKAASSDLLKTYKNVVVGGTFDRLHSGHKSLLTECCLRCQNKLTIGITDGERNKKKSLWELMEPYSTRKSLVEEFVSDVMPGIVLECIQIFDPFGPTINDPDFQCLVVSEETMAGGKAVNDERQKRGFSGLEMVVIKLVDDVCRSEGEEEKVSSSSARRRLLGTLIKPLTMRPQLSSDPYRVAVTGGIASGKSNVCLELERLGGKVINFDMLGHKAYIPGTNAFNAIVSEFGEQLVGTDGNIDRRKLGPIVFSDRAKLDKLNSIVWPAIRQLAEEAIDQHRADGVPVVFLEAAVLLEAGWDDMAHEIWTTFIPREEAVKRIKDRNQLTQDDAEKRIDSQISNELRIAKSNVVICPVWAKEVTGKQVEKAWALLQSRLKTNLANKL